MDSTKIIADNIRAYTDNCLKSFRVTVNNKDERIVLAKCMAEAKKEILEELGVTLEDVMAGKVTKEDIVFEQYTRDPFRLNVVDRRNVIEVEFEVLKEDNGYLE